MPGKTPVECDQRDSKHNEPLEGIRVGSQPSGTAIAGGFDSSFLDQTRGRYPCAI